jgi:hypothetical protein
MIGMIGMKEQLMSLKELKIEYRMERRHFLKWSAIAGAAGMVMNFPEAHAAGECETNIAPDAPEKGIVSISKNMAESDFAKDFFYWFDGPMHEGMKSASGGAVRGRLAVFLNLGLQGFFLESVAIADTNRRILDERRFHTSAATITKKPPYAIFDNLVLAHGQPYHIYFVLSSTDAGKKTVVVYRYEIAAEDVRASRFDYSHLSTKARERIPAMFLDDMKKAKHSVETEKESKFGLITTPYQNVAGLPTHTVRARFKTIQTQTETSGFSIYIAAMHGDINDAHYMRYFAVLDPVGRFLAVKRRDFSNNSAHTGHTDAQLKPGSDNYYELNFGYTPTASNSAGRETELGKAFGDYISSSQININDCPYVHVITEDLNDAIAKSCIRLR